MDFVTPKKAAKHSWLPEKFMTYWFSHTQCLCLYGDNCLCGKEGEQKTDVSSPNLTWLDWFIPGYDITEESWYGRTWNKIWQATSLNGATPFQM